MNRIVRNISIVLNFVIYVTTYFWVRSTCGSMMSLLREISPKGFMFLFVLFVIAGVSLLAGLVFVVLDLFQSNDDEEDDE